MNTTFVLLLMIFFHVVADYNQNWLALAKQKSYWETNDSNELYKYDYIWVLIMHSFKWTFMIMLPIAYIQQFNIDPRFFFMFVFNVVIHAITDNAKANWKTINLWLDQFVHMFQIFVTSILLYV